MYQSYVPSINLGMATSIKFHENVLSQSYVHRLTKWIRLFFLITQNLIKCKQFIILFSDF